MRSIWLCDCCYYCICIVIVFLLCYFGLSVLVCLSSMCSWCFGYLFLIVLLVGLFSCIGIGICVYWGLCVLLSDWIGCFCWLLLCCWCWLLCEFSCLWLLFWLSLCLWFIYSYIWFCDLLCWLLFLLFVYWCCRMYVCGCFVYWYV